MRGFVLTLLIGCCLSAFGQAVLEPGFLLLEQGDYQAAKKFFSNLNVPADYHKTMRICYARAVGLSGEPEQALALFRDLEIEYPENKEIRYNVAEALLWNDSYAQAKSLYASLLAEEPLSFVANYGYANAHAALDEDVQALKYMEVALSISPQNQQAHIALNSILLKSAFNAYKRGLYSQAHRYLDKTNVQYADTYKIDELRAMIVSSEQTRVGVRTSQDQDSDENHSSSYGLNVDFVFAERHRLSMDASYRQITNNEGAQAIQQLIAFQQKSKLGRKLEWTTIVEATGSEYADSKDTRVSTMLMLSGHLHHKLFAAMSYCKDNRDATYSLLTSQLYSHNYRLATNYMLTKSLGLYSNSEWQGQSDDNRLIGQVFSLYYTIKSVPLLRVGTNASLQFYKFQSSAYFSPERYRHFELFALLEKQASKRWNYKTVVSVGQQLVSDAPGQLTVKIECRMGYAFKSGLVLNGYFNYNSAAQVNTGGAYLYRQAGLDLSYCF